MTIETLINLAYVLAAGLFIFGLKLLSHPSTARKGNFVSAVGMFVAVMVTLLDQQIISYHMEPSYFTTTHIPVCFQPLSSYD